VQGCADCCREMNTYEAEMKSFRAVSCLKNVVRNDNHS